MTVAVSVGGERVEVNVTVGVAGTGACVGVSVMVALLSVRIIAGEVGAHPPGSNARINRMAMP